MQTYRYSIDGHGRQGVPFHTAGTVSGDHFREVIEAAQRASFEQVTGGHAVYGDTRTCSGPYTITHFWIDVVDPTKARVN